MNWRWNYNYGGGQLLDWIGHHGDIAHWGLDFDNGPAPRKSKATASSRPRTPSGTPAPSTASTLKYPNDVTMTIAGGHPDIKCGTKWIGTDGWVWVDRGGFDASNPEWKTWKDEVPENDRQSASLPLRSRLKQKAHYRNFLDCVKSRKPTITPVETAHHSLDLRPPRRSSR